MLQLQSFQNFPKPSIAQSIEIIGDIFNQSFLRSSNYGYFWAQNFVYDMNFFMWSNNSNISSYGPVKDKQIVGGFGYHS